MKFNFFKPREQASKKTLLKRKALIEMYKTIMETEVIDDQGNSIPELNSNVERLQLSKNSPEKWDDKHVNSVFDQLKNFCAK